MAKRLAYLETGSVSPYFNLAFEEYVLSKRRDRDYLLLWQNDRSVIIGVNQNADSEINRSYLEQNDIPLVRRVTGGGAVYHDLGNLNYSFITDAAECEPINAGAFVLAMVSALRSLGLPAEASGRNDILVGGCKVSGYAQRIMDGRLLHHGTLLFDSDLNALAAALKVDREKYIPKGYRSVESRVRNLSALLPSWSVKDLKRALLESIAPDCERASLSELELREVRELSKSKYQSEQWNYRKLADYDYVNGRRFVGGRIDVRVSVEKGLVRELVFAGDYMALRPTDMLSQAMTGCKYDKKSIAGLLEGFELREYFGSISANELLSVMFPE